MFSNEILKSKDQSLLLCKERLNSNLVIATPHHTPFGAPYMPCETPRAGDEGAGFIVEKVSEELDCSSIIASNYFIDPNKYTDSDYFRRIKRWNPKLLIEIHGHGSKSARFDIEISAGSIGESYLSEKFAETLRKNLAKTDLSDLSVSGKYNEIYFTAQYTKTITTDLWNSIHIELPWQVRGIERNSLEFSLALIATIREFMIS
jgi:hypothetical protein